MNIKCNAYHLFAKAKPKCISMGMGMGMGMAAWLVATYYNIYLIFISNFLPWHEAYEIATRPGQQRPWPWPET